MPIEGTQLNGHAPESGHHRGAGCKFWNPHSQQEKVPIEAAVEMSTSEWGKVRETPVARRQESCARNPRHERSSPPPPTMEPARQRSSVCHFPAAHGPWR
eukprot:5785398-Pleurochrysis_carterae.AAC.1